ncbi:DUF1697 domain-containing protein [Falsihalocynthiibacter sp. SS001]|uniref:DUF1697 domain-containing protein n=1 Tax=Falsihalocynthiibacter sp. SS001 TaxID=3349698 RepID=UPI0036D25A93
MNTWIAFLRGVNVGGHAKLPMKPLCSTMDLNGFEETRSYIQSGNLVFSHPAASANDVSRAVRSLLEVYVDMSPEVVALRPDTLDKIITRCPFEADDPKSLHYILFKQPPANANHEQIDALRAEDEAFEIGSRAAYLYAPSGIGRSRLAASQERLLGVPTTVRNKRTLEAVRKLAQG